MKKKMICAVLAALMLLCLVGCGGSKEPDPNAGLYKAESVRTLGMEMTAEEAFSGSELSIELMNGGKAKFNYEGETYNMTWTLEGDQFTAKDPSAELKGTLANGVLTIKNMMDMGLDVKLVCPEVAAANPAPAAAAEASEQTSEETEEENVLTNGTQIFFQNTMDVDIDGLYISNSDSWGDPVNDDVIKAGDAFIMDISKLPDGPGTYDVGATDVNGRNYDVYGVPLDGTRLVGLAVTEDTAVVVLIDGDGETETFTGDAYMPEEESEE